jgi:starch synthase
MRVLFASSEIFPLAKTGGLADVSAGLPAALAAHGVDVQLMMPAYPETLDRVRGKAKARCLNGLLGYEDVSIIPALMPDTGLPVWLVDSPSLFGRSGGLYSDADGQEWPDNAVRFAALSHAAARVAMGAVGDDWRADIAHANDWHLGLLPAILAAQRGPRPMSLLTIHNLAFQGLFPADVFSRIGLPNEYFSSDGVEFYGQISFLKAGIRYADRLTTVSPRYAQEIMTPEFGCGFDGLLRARAKDLVGILNGIDYAQWSPQDTSTLQTPYSADDLSGKRSCKWALQEELGLASDPDAPLYVFMSRITEQKMADVLPVVVPQILNRGGQFAVCGKGDRRIENALRAVAAANPGKVSVRIGYEESWAKRTLAGADVLLAPARFEPCGLTQMYGMRYGALPVVRRVGGLADTVTDSGEGATDSASTGFVFDAATADDFSQAIGNASQTYRNKEAWRQMQSRAMTHDFSWRRSADRYLTLYRDLIGGKDPDMTLDPAKPFPLRTAS